MLPLLLACPAVRIHHPHLPKVRTVLASTSDLDNYFHHSSRQPVGASSGEKLSGIDACVERCDGLGAACSGFSVETLTSTEMYCTIAGPGTGLSYASGVDFYRKKTETASVTWNTYHFSMLPSDAYDWYPVNMTHQETSDLCATTSQCAGFYTCTNATTDEDSTCANYDASIGAAHVLVLGLPAIKQLVVHTSATVYAKAYIQTCDGTANEASCSFPFSASTIDHAE
eukprot:3387923-Prymnesium_polylepis.1